MRVIFLAEKDCFVTIGGAPFGLVTPFGKVATVTPSDDLFVEFLPVEAYQPVRFILNEDFLFSPPEGVKLYFSDGESAIYVERFLHADQTLKALLQQRIDGVLFTLVRQGKLQMTVDSGLEFSLHDLSDSLEKGVLERVECGVLLRTERAFAQFSHTGKLLVSSEGVVLETGRTLKAEVPFHDSLGHTAVCEWEEGKLISCAVKGSIKTPVSIGLALVESVLIGADPTPYLAPSLIEKADELKDYLGNFEDVTLKGESVVGLVYPERERVFTVKYFTVQTDGDKVKNLLPE